MSKRNKPRGKFSFILRYLSVKEFEDVQLPADSGSDSDDEDRSGQVIILHKHKASSSVPQEPVISPVTSSSVPQEPVISPLTSSSVPQEPMISSSSVPQEPIISPVISSSVPQDPVISSSLVPQEPIISPVTSSSVPQEPVNSPVTSSLVPESAIPPVISSSVPQESAIPPVISSSVPQEPVNSPVTEEIIEVDQPVISKDIQDIHPKIRHRVTNALKEAVDAINEANETQADEPIESSRIKDCFKCLCFPNHSPFQKKTSKHLSNARITGAKMIPTIIFPSTPQLFRDTWVFFEVLFTIIQFIFGLISTNYRSNRLYNAFYISLSIVNIILAVTDAFLHYYQLGSCKSLFTRCKKRLNSNQEELQVENDTKRKEIIMDDVTDTQMKRCCHLSAKKKKLLNTWFEVIRTTLSELLLYPLVILDLFEIVGNQTLQDQINFSLFIVGSLYFVLTVYIARVVISALTLLTVKRLLSESKTSSSNIRFILRFLIHIISQVIVHISIVIAVGIKIRQENSAGNNYTASPILWAVVIGGWVIPFLGAVSFFNVNYYWMQQFATGIYVEMISLLQTPSVADSLFQSKSEMSLEHSKHFLENIEYKKVQKEYEQEVNTTSRFSKLIYPLKIPLFISFCILYNLLLGAFFACLLAFNI